jgi:hypothetical protein
LPLVDDPTTCGTATKPLSITILNTGLPTAYAKGMGLTRPRGRHYYATRSSSLWLWNWHSACGPRRIFHQKSSFNRENHSKTNQQIPKTIDARIHCRTMLLSHDKIVVQFTIRGDRWMGKQIDPKNVFGRDALIEQIWRLLQREAEPDR